MFYRPVGYITNLEFGAHENVDKIRKRDVISHLVRSPRKESEQTNSTLCIGKLFSIKFHGVGRNSWLERKTNGNIWEEEGRL